jgi:hypothetical protein
MINWLSQRRKAIWALLGFAVSEATVVNQLHPDAHVTLVLTILSLLGVGVVHQATNAPQV